ncbi:hypothetical protein CBS101457_006285 [Exobasidium rhododendri]|nr:hypothetical protein CBS101457_006285 [Exobasidium rhododendri]
MATTQAHPAASRPASSSTSASFQGKRSRAHLQGDEAKSLPRSQLKVMDDRKNRLEADENKASQSHNVSHSPPPSRSNVTTREEDQQPSSTARSSRALSGNGHASPRTQLPSFTNLTSRVGEEEAMGGKRRRLEGGDGSRAANGRDSGRPYSSPHQEYDEEEERQYRRDMHVRQPSLTRKGRNGQNYSPPQREEEYESTAPPPLPQPQASSERRHSLIGEDDLESNVPLARRRGDAAHAKASRLHIDTGSSEASGGFEAAAAAASHRKSLSSVPSHGFAKSAPPYKMTFNDREGPSSTFDPREIPSQRGYGNGTSHPSHPYYPGPYVLHRKEAGQDTANFNDASPTQSRRLEMNVPSQYGGVVGGLQQQQPQSLVNVPQSARHGVNTPLTAIRNNAFVPQTATLPSPAYHTTQFMRSHPAAGATTNSMNPGHDPRMAAVVGSNAVPKTAGLNPPPTARLPEHLRSPPSSKTQFLSLFSNFYDSLIDSRTLKATLEDQVRRSNTLLQTLQKSSRVLELTVDRRMREERNLWEAKVKALEERFVRLEKQVGTPLEAGESSNLAPRPVLPEISSPTGKEEAEKASPKAREAASRSRSRSNSSSASKKRSAVESEDVDELMNNDDQ